MERSTPIRQTNAQRVKRSTPTVRRMSSDGSDQLQPPDGCPTGERACHSNRRTGPRTESYVKSVVSIRAACEGPTSTPLQQHSLVGDRGRANHPPVMPVRQGSRTQVSMVGNLGQKPNSEAIIAASGAAKEGLQDPPGELPSNRSLKLPAKPSHPGPATATTVRGSAYSEAHASSALSACRRARSFAS